MFLTVIACLNFDIFGFGFSGSVRHPLVLPCRQSLNKRIDPPALKANSWNQGHHGFEARGSYM